MTYVTYKKIPGEFCKFNKNEFKKQIFQIIFYLKNLGSSLPRKHMAGGEWRVASGAWRVAGDPVPFGLIPTRRNLKYCYGIVLFLYDVSLFLNFMQWHHCSIGANRCKYIYLKYVLLWVALSLLVLGFEFYM